MFEILKNSQIQYFLVLAILLRLFLMPFLYHPDIKTYHFQASFLQNGVWDIYSYLVENKKQLPLKEEFVYFPLTYFFLGSYQILVSPLLGSDFSQWVKNPAESAIGEIGVYRYLFLLKFPYFLVDIAIGFLLTSFFVDSQNKKRVFLLWLFNPFSLYLIYIFSNVDILAVFLSLLSLLFLRLRKPVLAGIFLGLAAGFKVYPLLFLPFYIAYLNDLKQKILLICSSLITLGLIILPFLNSVAFRESALTSGLTTRIISGGLDIKFGEALLPAVVGIGLLLFKAYYEKNELYTFENLVKILLAVLLIVYSTIHFHIQWLFWSIPMVVLVIVQNKDLEKLIYLLLIIAISIPFLYQDKYMSVGLYSTISPLYNLIPMPYTLIQKIYVPQALMSVLHSLFLAGVIYSIFKMQKRV